MSNIRLNKITAETSGSLIIQNNNVRITDTTSSTSVLSGSFITDGGVSINCGVNAISSTSGGALTVGGGLAVATSTFLGGDATLENSSSIFKVAGVTNSRMYLGTDFYISPNGIDRRLHVTNTTSVFNTSTLSTNASTGAVVINGGLSINCQNDSTSASVGNAVTIAGGLAAGMNVKFAKELHIGETNSSNPGVTVRNTGTNQLKLMNSSGNNSASINVIGNNTFINGCENGDVRISTTNGNAILNENAIVSQISSTFQKKVLITDTIESINSSTGSLVVTGGTSIQCTTDATNINNGGGMTIAGGLGINKKTFIGDSLGLQVDTIDKLNKLILYQGSAGNSFIGLGTSSGSLTTRINNTIGSFTFLANNLETFIIKGSNEIQFIGDLQRYSIKGNGDSLALQGQSIATGMSLDLFTADGDSGDNVGTRIFGVGTPGNISNSEHMLIGWAGNNYTISTNSNGTGAQKNLVLETRQGMLNQFVLNTSGSINVGTTIVSSNSSTGGFIVSGGVSINCTNNVVNISSGGALTVAGGASFGKNVMVSNALLLDTRSSNGSSSLSSINSGVVLSTPTGAVSFATNNTITTSPAQLNIYTLGSVNDTDYEKLQISLSTTSGSSGYNISSYAGGTGLQRSISFNAIGNQSPQMYIASSGNIGLNTSSPSYTLDIIGDINANAYSYINGLNVYSTQVATNSSTASLVVSGGMSIRGNTLTNGIINSLNNLSCSNSSTASVVLAGGLSINCFTNATNVNNGGALTVAGGVAIAGDLIIGGNITYSNAAQASNTFAYLTLTSTDASSNISDGALVSFGGISIQNTFNATSVTSGGGITIAGGASIGYDTYIGNNLYISGTSTYYANTASNLINFYDYSNIQRFSINMNLSNNAFSIARYNSIGFIEDTMTTDSISGISKFNNTTASTSISNAAVVVAGGISINATSDAVQLGYGGSLTVSGGASIDKKLFVGGTTVFSNTTASSGVTNGSVTIAGGLGLGGNLNVGGAAIINGNLTVIGTTTTIESSNTLLTDNIIVLNSGPAGSTDSGFLIQRYQTNNDTGSGDVVSDASYFNDILPNQSGMSSSEIKLSTNANTNDDYYIGWWIKVTSGVDFNQVREIIGYIGSTRIATLSAIFTNQNPSITDTVSLYNKPFVGVIFSEANNRFEFCSTTRDQSVSSIIVTDTLPIFFSDATATGTQPSTSVSTGSVIITGGVSIQSTNNATSSTSGGAITIAGGAAVSKNLFIGNQLTVSGVNMTPNSSDIPSSITFTAANNSTAPITGLVFNSSCWSFDIYLAVQVSATTSLYSNYNIRGVNKNSTWEIITGYVGDDTVSFSINNNGQIFYTTPNYLGFTSVIFKYRCITN